MKRPNCRQALRDVFQQHSALSTIVKTARLLDVLGGRTAVARARSVHGLLLSLLLRFQQSFLSRGPSAGPVGAPKAVSVRRFCTCPLHQFKFEDYVFEGVVSSHCGY